MDIWKILAIVMSVWLVGFFFLTLKAISCTMKLMNFYNDIFESIIKKEKK